MGGGDFALQDRALAIDQQVAFASFDPFIGVVPYGSAFENQTQITGGDDPDLHDATDATAIRGAAAAIARPLYRSDMDFVLIGDLSFRVLRRNLKGCGEYANVKPKKKKS